MLETHPKRVVSSYKALGILCQLHYTVLPIGDLALQCHSVVNCTAWTSGLTRCPLCCTKHMHLVTISPTPLDPSPNNQEALYTLNCSISYSWDKTAESRPHQVDLRFSCARNKLSATRRQNNAQVTPTDNSCACDWFPTVGIKSYKLKLIYYC